MLHLPGKKALALLVGLAAATAGTAYAQDTTETGRAAMDTTAPDPGMTDTTGADTTGADTSMTRDTTDTAAVQNPQGYRGMERDTTLFPPAGGPPATPEEVKDQTTGTYGDSAWQDSTGAEQNPAGYRGMERPAGDSAAARDTTAVGDTEPKVEENETPRLEPTESQTGDTAGQAVDSTQ